MLYGLLLQDKNGLVQHTSLESFTQFAESTPYESLVPECLGDNQQLQNKVVAFLSKVSQNYYFWSVLVMDFIFEKLMRTFETKLFISKIYVYQKWCLSRK
jgi:hypothetical protein